jgi:hypothetical protein
MKNTLIVALIFIMSALAGCRNLYYSTMETVGYHKRDLLVSRVEDARDAQQDAKEQFKSALEKFSEAAAFKGGKLEAKYNELNTELEKSESTAKAVRKRIADVESVAKALFDEWKSELDRYSNEKLRRASEQKLGQTR